MVGQNFSLKMGVRKSCRVQPRQAVVENQKQLKSCSFHSFEGLGNLESGFWAQSLVVLQFIASLLANGYLRARVGGAQRKSHVIKFAAGGAG